MAGLTATGLQIKSQDDVIADYKAQAVQIFSDLVVPGDIVDTSWDSALGRIIGVVSPALADVWEAVQDVHNSFNPNAAKGISLDNLVALSGITRYAATATRSQVVFEGSLNTTVQTPVGGVYSSVTQRTYSIVNPVVLNQQAVSGVGLAVVTATPNTVYTFSYSVDGINLINTSVTSPATGVTSASILAQLKAAIDSTLAAAFTTSYKDGRLFVDRLDPFQTVSVSTTNNLRCEKIRKPGIVMDDNDGPYPADAYSIDTISVPIAGWDSVINPVPAVTGRLRETDEELRERFRNSKFIQSANIIEALLDEIKSGVAGVTDVVIYENDTDFTDANGVTPHAFMPIVLGGLPTDIANAIWQNKPNGIGSVGNTTVQIVDSQSIVHDISFVRPTLIPIYMKLDITNTGDMAGDAPNQIKQVTANYGNNTYFIGDDLIYSRFYTPINSIPGHQVNSFTMGTSPNPTGTSNISIPFNAVAVFDPANIIVNVT